MTLEGFFDLYAEEKERAPSLRCEVTKALYIRTREGALPPLIALANHLKGLALRRHEYESAAHALELTVEDARSIQRATELVDRYDDQVRSLALGACL